MTILSVAVRRGLALATTLALAGALLAQPVAAAKPTKCLVVNVGANTSFATLQAAVDAASAGDTLRVKGTCVGSTTIATDLTIVGKANPGFGPPTLDGNHAGRVITITGGVTVSLTGLTITNGTADRGGGIANDLGILTLIDSIVSGNTATDIGGGIHSSRYWGSLFVSGTSSINDNQAGSYGGGIYSDGKGRLTLSDTSSVHHNTAADGGGLFIMDSAGLTLNDSSTVHHNTATGNGGGVDFGTVGNSIRLNDSSSIHDNVANNGGGVYSYSGGVYMAGTSSISGNSAIGVGGGVYSYWGGVYMAGTSSISGNSAIGVGGGVYSIASTLSMQDASSIHDNIASSGGGVYSDAGTVVTLSGTSTITNNTPDNCYPPGTIVGCAN